MVTARELILPKMAGSSAPKKAAAASWGMAKATPEARVIQKTPLMALKPPPVSMTKTKGMTIIKGVSWSPTAKLRESTGRPVMEARVETVSYTHLDVYKRQSEDPRGREPRKSLEPTPRRGERLKEKGLEKIGEICGLPFPLIPSVVLRAPCGSPLSFRHC